MSSTNENRTAWETEAERLWQARAGDEARLGGDGGAVVFVEARTDGSLRAWTAPDGYLSRKPADVVADAAKALGLPAWGHVGILAKAWRERAGEAATAEIQPGRWEAGSHGNAGTYRAVPCVAFTAQGGAVGWYVDELDVREWSLTDLITMAADECGLATTEPPPPARTERSRRAGERRAAA